MRKFKRLRRRMNVPPEKFHRRMPHQSHYSERISSGLPWWRPKGMLQRMEHEVQRHFEQRTQSRLLPCFAHLEKSKAFAAESNLAWPGIVQASFAVGLASHSDIQRLASEVLRQFPKIDYLFNNAGVLTETLQFFGNGNELHFEAGAAC